MKIVRYGIFSIVCSGLWTIMVHLIGIGITTPKGFLIASIGTIIIGSIIAIFSIPMKVEYGLDHLPLCPDCKEQMDCESANGRDTETMGGYDVSYYRCSNCKEHYEVIRSSFDGDRVYPCSP